jgi:drug/metabolite transporter (DMT)-like permease
MRTSPALPYIEAFISVLFWSHAFVSIKYCLQSVTPLELVLLRHFPAMLVYLTYLAVTGSLRIIPDILRESPFAVIVGALSAVVAYHLPLNWGASHIPAGTTSLIVGTGPLFAFIFATMFIGEKRTWTKFLGIVVAFGGLYVCVAHAAGKEIAVTYWAGAASVLLGAAVAGSNIAAYRHLAQKYGAIKTTSTTIVLGTLPAFFFASPDLIRKLPDLSWQFWAVDLFLGLGCTASAYLLWSDGLSRVEASRLSAFIYLVPLMGLIWAWVYLDEPVTLWIVLGAAMIISGVAITNRKTANGVRT